MNFKNWSGRGVKGLWRPENRVRDQQKLKQKNEEMEKNESGHMKLTIGEQYLILPEKDYFLQCKLTSFFKLELKAWRSFLDPKSLFTKSKVKQAVN